MQIAFETKKQIDLTLIDSADDGFRRHLGASVIGRDCSRALFYAFRHCRTPKWKDGGLDDDDVERYGALMRLFQRGHNEESVFVSLLRKAGIWVSDVDPDTDEQYRISACKGHFGGSLDGIIVQVDSDHNEVAYAFQDCGPGVSEFKTHNEKSFTKLKKEGVRSAKLEHFVQMQIYMHKRKLSWALYMAVCKNDDHLYLELVLYDEATALEYLDRGERIIFTNEAPPKISMTPTFFACKFCDYSDQCHGHAIPCVNCRTCAHSTPVDEGNWSCALARGDGIIPRHIEAKGCAKHVFLPALLNFEYLGGDGHNATYKMPNKSILTQGPGGVPSHELADHV